MGCRCTGCGIGDARVVTSRASLKTTMSTEAQHQEEQAAGSFKLTPEEIEELEEAEVEATHDAKAGRLVPLAEVLAALRGA